MSFDYRILTNRLSVETLGASFFVFVKYWPPNGHRQFDHLDQSSLHIPFEFLYESDRIGDDSLPALCVRRFISAAAEPEKIMSGRYFKVKVRHELGVENVTSYVRGRNAVFLNSGFARTADEISGVYRAIVSENMFAGKTGAFRKSGHGVFSEWNFSRISDFVGLQLSVRGEPAAKRGAAA